MLEHRCIAEMRSQMLRADAAGLRNLWDAAAGVKGRTDRGDFTDLIRRDVLAYTMLHGAAIAGFAFTIFGGFVRSHFSGMPWCDLDIVSDDTTRAVLVPMLRAVTFVLPICSYDIDVFIPSGNYSEYGCKYEIRLLKHVINIDIVNKTERAGAYVPVSLGSSLDLTMDGATFFRQTTHRCVMISHIACEDIQALLRSGEDIKLAMPEASQSSKYGLYYWSRVKQMERAGWRFRRVIGIEPKPCADAEEVACYRERR